MICLVATIPFYITLKEGAPRPRLSKNKISNELKKLIGQMH